ncbi:MAG: hypothetical protein JSV07_06390, partial [Acidimicrobiia bacterium]
MRRTLFVVVLLATFVPLASPALAEGETVQGVLEKVDGEERSPVEGAVIKVFLGEAQVGEGTSGPDGEFSIPVPGAETYRVQIDAESLPSGVGLTDPERNELPNVRVR